MARLILAWAMGALSTACAMAAVGWTLYAAGPSALWAAQCFGAFGLASGLVCGALHLHYQGLPPPPPQALPPDALASLVRATLASAVAERQARPGSAADRQPRPADSAGPAAGVQAAAAALATGMAAEPARAVPAGPAGPAAAAKQLADSLS